MITVITTVTNKAQGWTSSFAQAYAQGEQDKANYYIAISQFENAEWVISARQN